MAAILDALASYLQNMLMEMAKDEVHMLLGVSGEIDKMGVKLGDLKNFLADADRRNITDKTVPAWVTELRDTMYDATNILDLCQLKAMDQGPSQEMGCFNPLLFCMRSPLHAHNIGSRIKKLNQRLDDIKARSKQFNFVNLSSYEYRGRKAAYYPSSVETTGGLDESGLVGETIKEDTGNLVDMLIKDERTHKAHNKIMVFAIVGVGGIGKTTLARKIFNNDIIQQEFTKKIWLSVNKDYSETEILRRATTEAGGNHHVAGNTKATLERTLMEALNGHKTLLIMDDVWDYRAWEDVLRTPLINASLAHGVRILVTTRHDSVARGMMAEKPYHRVHKLEAKDAWLLLKKQVVGNESDEAQIEQLKDIGMKIVEKCDCLPLAVKVIGGLLRQKITNQRDWEKILNDWSVSEMPEDLNNAIYLSYEDLHPCLKPCFLHYSLLPKRTLFYAHDIVGMWISEGFVHGTLCDLEEIGKEYYDELIQRNLIEPNVKYVDKKVCNMHDVVRSFAQYVARNEAQVALNSETGISKSFNSEKFIRLSILETEGSESKELEWCSLQAYTSLRTLIFVGHIKIKPGDSLFAFSNLRTLHIQKGNFEALVESLDQLKHLRYLSIERTNTSRLPENIGKLKFLQYISVHGCGSLVKLPNSISKLQQLRFLNLGGTSLVKLPTRISKLQQLRCLNLGGSSIKYIPRGFNGLSSLRKLYGFPADMDGDWCSLEELGPLSHLMELHLSDLENVSSSSFATKAKLDDKVRLTFLCLRCTTRLGDDGQLIKEEEGIFEKEQRQIEEVFDELCPPCGLEHLGIEGYFGQVLPRWMMSTAVVLLRSLRILMMEDLACCTEFPNGLCQLPCLELLQIVRAPAIKCVGFELLQRKLHSHSHSQAGIMFPRLSKLNFNGLVEWEEWEWEKQIKGMPILEELRLQKCKLRHLPPGLAFHARTLKKLFIYDVMHLRSLQNFTSVVHLDVFGNTDLESISNLPKLQKLVILNCPKLKVLEGMPALQKLQLVDYIMETVPRYVRDVKPRHLLLDCTLSVLCSIAAGKSGPEWDTFNHIQQVKAFTDDEGISMKWCVLYTRDPFHFETNISRPAIVQAINKHKWFAYFATCPIEDERPVGHHAHEEKRQPLCLRFRCNAFRHLAGWLREVCLHCSEAQRIASSSDQWTEAAGHAAYVGYRTRYGRLQQQEET